MKGAASILMVIWGFLIVQPAFDYFGGKSAYGACSKTTTTKSPCSKKKVASSTCTKQKPPDTGCSKGKCNKPLKSQSKDECSTDGCNPTVGCSSGNFYIFHHYYISLSLSFIQKQKAKLIDDNRILKNISECWHPPEIGSV